MQSRNSGIHRRRDGRQRAAHRGGGGKLALVHGGDYLARGPGIEFHVARADLLREHSRPRQVSRRADSNHVEPFLQVSWLGLSRPPRLFLLCASTFGVAGTSPATTPGCDPAIAARRASSNAPAIASPSTGERRRGTAGASPG